MACLGFGPLRAWYDMTHYSVSRIAGRMVCKACYYASLGLRWPIGTIVHGKANPTWLGMAHYHFYLVTTNFANNYRYLITSCHGSRLVIMTRAWTDTVMGVQKSVCAYLLVSWFYCCLLGLGLDSN